MIQTDMKEYHVPVITTTTDGYGQTNVEEDWDSPAGVIMMALYPTDYETQSNYGWNLATFVGLTQSITYGPVVDGNAGNLVYKKLASGSILKGGTPLNDWEDDKFEVISILKLGRYYQVFMREKMGS